MSAITIILASLSALALAILILAVIDDRKRQQRLVPMKLGAMSRESFVNREECGTSPWGRSPRGKSRPKASSSAKPSLRADAQRGLSFPASPATRPSVSN
jgi:hypothetical protein